MSVVYVQDMYRICLQHVCECLCVYCVCVCMLPGQWGGHSWTPRTLRDFCSLMITQSSLKNKTTTTGFIKHHKLSSVLFTSLLNSLTIYIFVVVLIYD